MGKIDTCMAFCDVVATIEKLQKQFDTHSFIDAYKRMFSSAYQNLISNYKYVEGAHKLMGKYLSIHRDALRIESSGRSRSVNVYGRKSECELWRKV